MRPIRVLALTTLAAPVAAGDLVLDLPLDCDLGRTCHIQQYVDHDPGPGWQDHACGTLAYDGHKGTDFALPSLAALRAGVDVLAAAAGQVRAIRDGVADQVMTAQTAAQVEGRECGNGVVLAHPDGWETQYCHLRNGSVRVRSGDTVTRGQVLGQVGLSGKTQFPHVHLSVRRDGQVIDPFAADGPATAACGQGGHSLWRDTPSYHPGGAISAGFADRIPAFQDIKDGTAGKDRLPRNAGALVVWGYFYGGRAGDEIEIVLDGPRGRVSAQNATLERTQAQFFRAAGRRLNGPDWPVGPYTGTLRLLRDGVEIDRIDTAVTLE